MSSSTGGVNTSGGSNGSGGGSGSGGNPATGGVVGTGGTNSNQGSTINLGVALSGLLDGTSTTWEQARDVAIDDQGSIYIVGGASSPDFPVTNGAYDTTYNTGGAELGTLGDTDAFIVKLDSSGNIVWGTYLGGPNYDRAYGVEVDEAHNVYVGGRAGNGFPTTAGVLQTTFAGDSNPNGPYGSQDGFVAKISADGSTLMWSTYIGETGPGFVRDIDVDSNHRVHVALSSINGADMDARVTTDGHQKTRLGDFDSFYLRLASDGSSVEYGTYLGGNDTNGYFSSNPSVRVLDDGTAYVLVNEPGAGAPTTAGVYQPNSGGGYDLLLAKFSPSGSTLFCTYLGGSGDEFMDTHHLALDASDNAVVAADTNSSDYPLVESTIGGGALDVVVSVVSKDGKSLLHSIRVGGSAADATEGVSLDANGNIYVSGFTLSDDLPVTADALSSTYSGSREGLLMVLSADLSTLRYLSYDGIIGEYANRSSMVEPDGTWAVVGAVWKMNPFPATSGQDNMINGQHAAFFRVYDQL